MTDSTHDAAQMNDDAFHEIQLSGKQLVFLFMATTLGLVFVFLLGVQVGRNAKSDRPSESQDTAASAAAVPPPASTPTSAPASAESGPPAAEPPAPADDSDDELSYAKRLQGESAPAEKLKAPREAAAAPERTAPATTAAPKGTPAAPAAAPAQQTASSGGRPGVWVVQLVALKDHAAASAVAQQLVAKGYPAFVVSPGPGAPPIYRVQVGRYNDRREAEQVARRLEKEGQFKPWISH